MRLTGWIEDEELCGFVRRKINQSGDKLTSRRLAGCVREFLKQRGITDSAAERAIELELQNLEREAAEGNEDQDYASDDDSISLTARRLENHQTAMKDQYRRSTIIARQMQLASQARIQLEGHSQTCLHRRA